MRSNMGNWPPRNSTLQQACTIFTEGHKRKADPFDTLKAFLGEYAGVFASSLYNRRAPVGLGEGGCFDMAGQMPAGSNATISAGDWSGVGPSHLRCCCRCCCCCCCCCCCWLRARCVSDP